MSHLHPKRTRRGNVAVFALALVPLVGFSALSVDVGLQRMGEVQVQAASESAAMAGSARLDGTTVGLLRAIDQAVRVGNLNEVHGDFAMTAHHVQLGIYDQDDGSFTPVTAAHPFPMEVNAVRVSAKDSHDSLLSRLAWGVQTLNTYGSAVAIQPRGGVAKRVDCYLPLAIPLCHFLHLEDGVNPEPLELDLGNMNTVGWGLPRSSPSTETVRDQFADSCANGSAETLDPGAPLDDGSDLMHLSNGQNTDAVAFVGEIISGDIPGPAEPWPDDLLGEVPLRNGVTANIPVKSFVTDAMRWGFNVQGVVPIVDHDCGEQFTGTAPIVGWTYAYLYDGKPTGADGKNIFLQFDMVNDYDLGWGQCEGDCYGGVTGELPSEMVR